MKIRIFVAVIILAATHHLQVLAQTYDTNNDVVQTFAGSGIPGYIDGQGQETEFSNPSEIVADTFGNLYVWDSGNRLIRRITTNATVSTFIGGGTQLEGYGTNVSFSSYSSVGLIAIDHSNTIWTTASYVGFTYLLRITPDTYGLIENAGLSNLTTSSGLCFDSANNLYYSGGNRVYRYNPNTGISQVFVGSGVSGHLDGNGIFTEFSTPGALVCDQADNIYVYDSAYLRKIDQAQNVTTITNLFNGTPQAVDNTGNIIGVGGTSGTSYVFKLTTTTNFVLYAGTTSFSPGNYTNGPGNLARFNTPSGACLSQGSIFVADSGNQRIRQISFNPQPQVISAGNLGFAMYPGVTITGIVGRTYQIQSSPDLNAWTPRGSILLTSSPFLWIDQNPVAGNQFYRALLLP